MKKIFDKIVNVFKGSNRRSIQQVCKYANGELGSYCESERIYIK